MNETGAIKKSIEAAKNLGEQAIKSVEKFNVDGLESIVKSMIDRKFYASLAPAKTSTNAWY